MKQYLNQLKQCPFFTGMNDEEILSILHCVSARSLSVKKDAFIFRA